MYGVGGIVSHIRNSALHGDEWSASCSGHFTPWHPLDKSLGGPIAGLDAVWKRQYFAHTGK